MTLLFVTSLFFFSCMLCYVWFSGKSKCRWQAFETFTKITTPTFSSTLIPFSQIFPLCLRKLLACCTDLQPLYSPSCCPPYWIILSQAPNTTTFFFFCGQLWICYTNCLLRITPGGQGRICTTPTSARAFYILVLFFCRSLQLRLNNNVKWWHLI